jgi:hypothetical protein
MKVPSKHPLELLGLDIAPTQQAQVMSGNEKQRRERERGRER